MELATLEALYLNELRDLWSAETQIQKLMPTMIAAAESEPLKEALTRQLNETDQQLGRLMDVFDALGERPEGKKCVGMEGLLKEITTLIKAKPERGVLDAGLIAAFQHVKHYEIAGYGTARTWANLLGNVEQAVMLQETLNDEVGTDRYLSSLAEQINVLAGHVGGYSSGRNAGSSGGWSP